jgi:hypothetical protein
MYCLPNSVGADREIAADLAGFTSIVNDQVDSLSPQRVAYSTEICTDVLALLRSDQPTDPATPYGEAWCDLWYRMAEGMSSAWRARFRLDFSQLFIAYLAPDTRLTVERYLELRQSTFCTAVVLHLAERGSGFELPPPARTEPLIKSLVAETNNLRVLTHDVYALDYEEPRGKVENIVLILEHTTGRSRAQVIADVQDMVRASGERFLQFESRIPALAATLGFGSADRAALTSYIQAMRDLVRGEYDWHKQVTSRYDLRAAAAAIASGYEAAGPE